VEISGGEKFRFRLVGREGRVNQLLYDFEKRWMHVKKKNVDDSIAEQQRNSPQSIPTSRKIASPSSVTFDATLVNLRLRRLME
jgi:hypothetical protein